MFAGMFPRTIRRRTLPIGDSLMKDTMMRSKMIGMLALVGLLGLAACDNNKTDSTASGEPIKSDKSAAIPPAPEPVTDPVITVQPAPMPTAAPAAKAGKAATAKGNTYVVQKGDTLMSIARNHYGNASKFRDIASANGITDPAKIKVGQTLILP